MSIILMVFCQLISAVPMSLKIKELIVCLKQKRCVIGGEIFLMTAEV